MGRTSILLGLLAGWGLLCGCGGGEYARLTNEFLTKARQPKQAPPADTESEDASDEPAAAGGKAGKAAGGETGKQAGGETGKQAGGGNPAEGTPARRPFSAVEERFWPTEASQDRNLESPILLGRTGYTIRPPRGAIASEEGEPATAWSFELPVPRFARPVRLELKAEVRDGEPPTPEQMFARPDDSAEDRQNVLAAVKEKTVNQIHYHRSKRVREIKNETVYGVELVGVAEDLIFRATVTGPQEYEGAQMMIAQASACSIQKGPPASP